MKFAVRLAAAVRGGALPLLAACALAAGCGSVKNGESRSPRGAMTHSSRVYELGKVPDQEREQAFQDLLTSAQAAAAAGGGDYATGFSYSLSPRGAVYPFSEVEVVCLVQRSDSASGDDLCSGFFRAVDAGLRKVLDPSSSR